MSYIKTLETITACSKAGGAACSSQEITNFCIQLVNIAANVKMMIVAIKVDFLGPALVEVVLLIVVIDQLIARVALGHWSFLITI